MPPLTGSGGGVIAFASDRDGGDWEIYVMNADGSDQRRLTRQPRTDQRPSWSPDGAWIAFTSRRKGSEDVFVMRADGSDVRQLTTGRSNDFLPAWSPDGTQIVFVGDRDRDTELYVLGVQEAFQDPDNSTQLQLTDNDVQDDSPNWSPAPFAGRGGAAQIAFVSNRDGNDEIYVMNADGSEVHRLTHNEVDDWWPVWSPDGKQIAFTSGRDGDYAVYLMKADGTEQRRLTYGEADDWRASWSADGTQLAFQSNPEGQWDIYVINADGTGLRRLTTSGAADQHPAWRP
jgi:Tol biopolymer transport system component